PAATGARGPRYGAARARAGARAAVRGNRRPALRHRAAVRGRGHHETGAATGKPLAARDHAMSAVHTVVVDGNRPYPIHIGADLLADGALLAASLRGRQALIVSDANVAPLYAPRVEAALRSARPDL